MKLWRLIWLLGLLTWQDVTAQQGGVLDIQLSKSVLQPGDSVLVTASYTDSADALSGHPLATLEIIIENEQGQRTRLRWPVMDNQASGILYIPDSMPDGKYNLVAGLQQRSFEVTGQLLQPYKSNSITAMLLTGGGHWDEQEVPVAPNGSFLIRNWLFADNALLAFSASDNHKRPLDIKISTRLDSANNILAVAGKSFYIGKPPGDVEETVDKKIAVNESDFWDKGDLLPAVLVRTNTKSRAQQFNEAYARGMFRSDNERILSIMDDPTAIGSRDVLWYLQGRVAGLQVSPAGMNASAMWRGSPVAFFLDEMLVSPQAITSIPMVDVAIVKVYPPPFFGAPGGGSGGAVAVYTRRGGEASLLPANRQVFKVRGYSAEAIVLDMNKMVL